ncbi:hypothetical protein F4777DRAFT_568716 [Nemania sp. FL0916]|nr:hypothetical protein F4777DRAFT_568716 [Nemania sp. FL0916]
MRHTTDFAVYLALLLASSVSAVPAREISIRNRGVIQNNAADPEAGLVPLPGAQITTGDLKPLPGQTTASEAQSSIAASTTSATLGETTSQSSATLTSSTSVATSLVPLPGLSTSAESSAIVSATSVVLPPAAGSPIHEILPGTTQVASIGSTIITGGFQIIGANPGAELSSLSSLSSSSSSSSSSSTLSASLSTITTIATISTEVAATSTTISTSFSGFFNTTAPGGGGGLLLLPPATSGFATGTGLPPQSTLSTTTSVFFPNTSFVATGTATASATFAFSSFSSGFASVDLGTQTSAFASATASASVPPVQQAAGVKSADSRGLITAFLVGAIAVFAML